MALKLLQTNGCTPFGQFDGLDSQYLTLKGGEVVTLGAVALSTNDKAAHDDFDGYQNPGTNRVVVQFPTSGNRPLFLADDGITGYGTLFGSVVGGVVGQVVTGGTVLGPHTATGSGKVTCWSNPGLYAVSLDAVDTTSSTGLVPTNTSAVTGVGIKATAAGLLTVGSSTFENVILARFVEFESNGSLVTTPSSLVGTLNTPDGALSTTVNRTLSFAVFYWNPPVS